jgi:hypothetical protein
MYRNIFLLERFYCSTVETVICKGDFKRIYFYLHIDWLKNVLGLNVLGNNVQNKALVKGSTL